MMVLDAMVAGAFYVAGIVTAALVIGFALFTSWAYGWPRGVWK